MLVKNFNTTYSMLVRKKRNVTYGCNIPYVGEIVCSAIIPDSWKLDVEKGFHKHHHFLLTYSMLHSQFSPILARKEAIQGW